MPWDRLQVVGNLYRVPRSQCCWMSIGTLSLGDPLSDQHTQKCGHSSTNRRNVVVSMPVSLILVDLPSSIAGFCLMARQETLLTLICQGADPAVESLDCRRWAIQRPLGPVRSGRLPLPERTFSLTSARPRGARSST